MEYSSVAIILTSLALSAFFSGIEIAFVSANKLKIELDKKLGSFPARIYSYFTKYQSRFITAMLLGNNIALVVYGIVMGNLLEPSIAAITSNAVLALLLQTVVSTLIILVTAEFIPKVIFRINPNGILGIFAVPITIIYVLLFVPVMVTIWIADIFLRYVFKAETSSSEMVFNLVDLDNLVKEATAEQDQDEIDNEIQIFQNALDFSSVKARECMVPRTEIIALELEDSINELRDLFVETGLSKIIIYRDNIDNIIGYTHSYEMFKHPEAIKNILLPISIIPETMPANEVLELLIEQKRSIAVVVDEFGGTAGLLTMEDVVEEIFGEIEDEHDHEELVEEVLGPGEYRFAARLEVDYLNNEYDLNLPDEEDFETLAGLIIHLSESIPEQNEEVENEQFVFTIEKVDGKRIECVRVKEKTRDN